MPTPSNTIITYGNLIDRSDCVLSCTVTPTLSLDYLKNPIRRRVTRIPASPAFGILGTHGGSTVSARMAALFGTNLTTAATARFVTYSNADHTGTSAVDITANPAVRTASLGQLAFDNQKVVIYFPAAVSFKSWVWVITDTANPSPIDISRAHISSVLELGTNVEYGLQWSLQEDSQLWLTDGGSIRADVGGQYRRMVLPLSYFTEAERAQLASILEEMGIGRSDFVVSIFPGGTAVQLRDYELDVVFQQMPDLALVAANFNQSSFTVRER